MTLSIIAIIALLAANAFFVAAEFALVKAKSIRIDALAEDGSTKAKLTQRILTNLEAYLAACQLGITMASLGLGWVGEPAVAALLQPSFRAMGISEVTLHTVSFIVGFLIFSSLHIVIGEQVPKTMAIRQSEATSLWTAYPLHAFYLFCFPLNWALNRASRAILAAIGVGEFVHGEVYSGEEIRDLIGVSHRHGAVHKPEHDMLGGILDLAEVEVGEIMTHRTNIESVDADCAFADVVKQVCESPFTRFPLYRDTPETVIGVLHAKDVLAAALQAEPAGEQPDLTSIAAKPWFIPETTSLRHQLAAFRQRREHLAIVVDEYGAIEGVVTLEDIIEEIVGDIADEKDIEVSGVELQADGSLLVEGHVTLRDLNRQFGWELPDDEAATVAGLLIHEVQRIPEIGQDFKFHGFRFEVVAREGNQLTMLRVQLTTANHDSKKTGEQ